MKEVGYLRALRTLQNLSKSMEALRNSELRRKNRLASPMMNPRLMVVGMLEEKWGRLGVAWFGVDAKVELFVLHWWHFQVEENCEVVFGGSGWS